MSDSRVVSRPESAGWHPCHPGSRWHEHREWDSATMVVPDPPTGWYVSPTTDEAPGTVAECATCGKRWVVVRVPEQSYVGRRGEWWSAARNVWEAETDRERRRRVRREARVARRDARVARRG